jgi:osmotically-inducible protein OsmY
MRRDDHSDQHHVWPDTGTGTQYNYGTAGGQGGSSFRGGQDGPGGTIAEASLQRGPHTGRGPRNFRRSDAHIQEDLSERLYHDQLIDSSDVEVEVRDGVVLLTGTVSDRDDRWRIEDIAEQIAGVREVTNRIRLARFTFSE